MAARWLLRGLNLLHPVGYLITSLLAAEYNNTQRIGAGAFYTRRAKRLIPASLVCVSAVCILAAFHVWDGANHLRRYALGAVLQVSNWVQLTGGGSYTDLQSKRAGLVSPLEHFWSLGVEEQFYWLWPMAFWTIAATARQKGWSLTRIMVFVTVAAMGLAPAIATIWGPDAAYWATPARLGEILLGALVAVAVREGRLSPRAWMAPTCLTVVVILACSLPASGGPAYSGLFPMLAIASAGLLLGLQMPGPVRSALSWRPMVAIGAVSYGLYLFHFPIFVVMSAQKTGLNGIRLFAAGIAVTSTVTVVVYRLVERPIRRATWRPSRTLLGATVALALAIAAVGAVPAQAQTSWSVPEAARAAAAIPTGPAAMPLQTAQLTSTTTGARLAPVAVDTTSTPAAQTTAEATTTAVPTSPPGMTTTKAVTVLPLPVPNRPVRIIVLGDSTAEAAGSGLIRWAALNPTIAKVDVLAQPECGFIRGGHVPTDGDVPYKTRCDERLDHDLPIALRDLQPDVVMLMTTIRDIETRVFDNSEGPLTPTDQQFSDRARADYEAITNLILTTSQAQVVWVSPPAPNAYWLGTTPASDAVDRAVIDGIMTSVATEAPGRVSVLDMKTWFDAAGLRGDHSTRPDGIHLGDDGGLDIATRFLGPELVARALAATG